MEHRPLHISEIIKYGFSAAWNHVGTLLKAFLACMFVYIAIFGSLAALLVALCGVDYFSKIVSFMQEYQITCTNPDTPECITKIIEFQQTYMPFFGFMILCIILLIILQNQLGLGFLNIVLNLHDHKPAPISLLVTTIKYLPTLLAAFFMYILATSLGLMCLIIPGIIIATRFSFFWLFILDQQCGPIEALKRSYNLTRGYTWQLLKLMTCMIVCLLAVGLAASLIEGAFALLALHTSMVYALIIMLIAFIPRLIIYAAAVFCYIYVYRQLMNNSTGIFNRF